MRRPSGIERARALALRALAIVALAAAAAGLRLPAPRLGRSLVLLLDVSDSVASGGLEELRASAGAVLASLGPRDRAAVLAFAGGIRELSGFAEPGAARRRLLSAELSAPEPGESDLAAALARGAALARVGGGEPLLVLLSDGRPTRGGTELAAAAGRGLPVHVLPAGRARPAGHSVELSAPAARRPGEAFEIAYRVESPRAAELEFELLADGIRVAGGGLALGAGGGLFRASVPASAGAAGGALPLVLRLREPGGEVLAETGALVAESGEGAVLVASGGTAPSPLAAALRAQGIPARAFAAAELPRSAAGWAGASAAVLDDVPALALGEGQQEALRDFVSGGGGLLVVGGGSSLGRGEYYATGLEELLPVSTDTRRRLLYTRARLLFVLDVSGSMSERLGSGTKLGAALDAVAAAFGVLNPQDEVGVLGFDALASWILPFGPADRGPALREALAVEGGGGGTSLGVALEEVLKAFGPPGPTKRHAVVLTDGLSTSADYESLTEELRAAGISLSTVGVGARVDEELLASLAASAGGRYHRAELDRLPLILNKETVAATREMVVEGSFSAAATAEAPPFAKALAGGASAGGAGADAAQPGAPRFGGYLRTELKPYAEAWLTALPTAAAGSPGAAAAAGTAGDRTADPLLASWRYGAGRVAVFASDSGSRWLAPWTGSPSYGRLWAGVIRAIEDRAAGPAPRLSLRVEGGELLVRAELRDAEGRLASGRAPEARLFLAAAPEGAARPAEGARRGAGPASGGPEAFRLVEVSRGLYEARVPAAPGLLGVEVSDRLGDTRSYAGLWSPPGAEAAASGPDRRRLSDLAKSAGGRVLDAAAPALPPARLAFVPREASAFLAGLALALFFLELLLRSSFMGHLAAAWAEARDRRKRAAEEAARLLARPWEEGR